MSYKLLSTDYINSILVLFKYLTCMEHDNLRFKKGHYTSQTY